MKRGPTLTNQEALAARPIRLVDAPLAPRPDGGGAITVPLRPPTKLKWLFKLPAGAAKTFELDAIGVLVWDALDGHTTVEQIIHRVAARYHLNLRDAQVPTLQFLQTLMKKGLVGVPTVTDRR